MLYGIGSERENGVRKKRNSVMEMEKKCTVKVSLMVMGAFAAMMEGRSENEKGN